MVVDAIDVFYYKIVGTKSSDDHIWINVEIEGRTLSTSRDNQASRSTYFVDIGRVTK